MKATGFKRGLIGLLGVMALVLAGCASGGDLDLANLPLSSLDFQQGRQAPEKRPKPISIPNQSQAVYETEQLSMPLLVDFLQQIWNHHPEMNPSAGVVYFQADLPEPLLNAWAEAFRVRLRELEPQKDYVLSVSTEAQTKSSTDPQALQIHFRLRALDETGYHHEIIGLKRRGNDQVELKFDLQSPDGGKTWRYYVETNANPS